MSLNGKTALVIGGSKGLGKGAVHALAAEGADVWAVARGAEKLEELKQEIGNVQTISADIADPKTAPDILHETRPDIVVLNAGVIPHIGPVHEQTWEQFSLAWETDVKAAFHFGKEAMTMPLASGSTMIIVSSGAAIGGSPISGGYSGAKRTQWFLANFLQQQSEALGLGIRFMALLPKQLVGTTGIGHVASSGYAKLGGISKEKFLERFGENSLTPDVFGQGVVSLLTNEDYQKGIAYGITGAGLESLD